MKLKYKVFQLASFVCLLGIPVACFAQSSDMSAEGSRDLVCQGYGPIYARQLSQAAADSLVAAGHTNFKVKVSLKADGPKETLSFPPNRFGASSFTVSPVTKNCKQNRDGQIKCKGGAELAFVGEFSNDIEGCQIKKILTIDVTLKGGPKISKSQQISLPGRFVYKSREASNYNSQVSK